jgi:hypothetical protein
MAIQHLFNSWIEYISKVIFLGIAQPDPAKFYAILCNTNTINRTTTIADIVALELPATNGYSRQQIIFLPGNYNNPDNRYEQPSADIIFSANNNGNYQFQTVVILANASPLVGNTSGMPVGFYQRGSIITINANQSLAYTVPIANLNTGYVAGN